MATVTCVGHAVMDYVFSVGALPTEGRKYAAHEFRAVGGGPAASAAVAIARLGGAARLAARLGDDATGALIVEDLEREGVDCAMVRRVDGRTSALSAVMIDKAGERMIVNYADPAMPREADWLPDVAFAAADATLADMRWPEGTRKAMRAARDAGRIAVLDIDGPGPFPPALVAAPTHAAFSADALIAEAGGGSLRDALGAVARRRDGWTCVTDGAHGALLSDGEVMIAVGAFAVDVVDTLGAGDVWHGAFALRLAEGADEPEAARFAAAAAALKVSRPGGRAGAPSRRDVEDLLASRQPMEPRL